MVPNEPAHPARSYVVVADAGPLLHLDELDALEVLNDFEEIVIVPAVNEELRKHRPAVLVRCPKLTFLEIVPPPQ